MQFQKKKIFLFLILLLIVANFGLFIFANTYPINWIHPEMNSYNYFWSTDSSNAVTLHTGLKASDLLKPFDSKADYFTSHGFLRPRQVSYFFEMLSLKFWQYFGAGILRNYFLIGIHLTNTVLLGVFLFFVTGRIWAAFAGSLFLLNAAPAVTTLLFPFRNAKILVITFFLINLIIIATSKKEFWKASSRRILTFFAILILSFFTDETAYLISPFLLIYIYFRDGPKGLFNRRFIFGAVAVIFTTLALYFLFFLLARNISSEHVNYFQGRGIKSPFVYFGNWHAYFDVIRSFTVFIRRDFGYWDLTFFGFASLMAFGCLLIIPIGRLTSLVRQLCAAIILMITVKAVLLPHVHVHYFIMPPDTVFPSLLYFSYYYVYGETVFLSMFMGLLLSGSFLSNLRTLIIIGLITVISASNVFHQKEALVDTLMFHQSDDEDYQQFVKHLVSIRQFLANKDLLPVYVSFPINTPFLKDGSCNGNCGLPKEYYYSRNVPVIYLRAIEEGKIITSLQNIKSKIPFQSQDELSNAKYFFNVLTGEVCNLEFMKKGIGNKQMVPNVVTSKSGMRKFELVINKDAKEVVFFIKGNTQFIAKINNSVILDKLSQFGYSYEMFKIKIDQKNKKLPIIFEIDLYPPSNGETVYLVGPWAQP